MSWWLHYEKCHSWRGILEPFVFLEFRLDVYCLLVLLCFYRFSYPSVKGHFSYLCPVVLGQIQATMSVHFSLFSYKMVQDLIDATDICKEDQTRIFWAIMINLRQKKYVIVKDPKRRWGHSQSNWSIENCLQTLTYWVSEKEGWTLRPSFTSSKAFLRICCVYLIVRQFPESPGHFFFGNITTRFQKTTKRSFFLPKSWGDHMPGGTI